MLKRTLYAIFIIAIVILAVPALMGQYLHYDINKKLPQIQWPGNYQVKIVAYNTGWFTSQVKLMLSMKPSQAANQKQASTNITAHASKNNNNNNNAKINLTLYHGPISYSHGLTGKGQWSFGQAVVKGTAHINVFPVNIYAKIDFNGSVHLDFLDTHGYMSGYMRTGNEVPIDLTTIILKSCGSLVLSPHWRHITGQTKIVRMSFNSHRFLVIFNKIMTTFNIRRDKAGNWFGTQEDVIPVINILNLINKNIPLITLYNVSIGIKTANSHHKINAKINASIKKISYGKHESIGPMEFQYQINNIDENKLATLGATLESLNADFNKRVAPDKLKQHRDQVMDKLAKSYLSVLAGTTQRLTNFSVITANGPLSMRGYLAFPNELWQTNNGTTANHLPFLVNLIMMVTKARAQLDMSVSEAFVTHMLNKLQKYGQDYSSAIVQLQRAGILKTKGEDLVSAWSYRQGQASVNNIPLQEALLKFKQLQEQDQQQAATTTNNNNRCQVLV